MIDYLLHSYSGLFFYYFELKPLKCCVMKNKRVFGYIKFSRILRPSEAPTLRCLRRPKNPTNGVGLRYVGH